MLQARGELMVQNIKEKENEQSQNLGTTLKRPKNKISR